MRVFEKRRSQPGWGRVPTEPDRHFSNPMDSPRVSRSSIGSHRTIYCNDPRSGLQNFKGNAVSTTKYSLFSFLPKGLFEQFRRVANLYFLLIAILSTTPVSPLHPITNIAPLVLVLTISLMKEAFEDRKRFKSDIIINSSMTEILRGNEWITIAWKDVHAGDVVRVRANHYFPADLLCLASTNTDGVCYIETSNLDGETNLKIRKALERTWDYVTADSLSEFRSIIECEQPNNSLYTFVGNLVIGKQTLPISPNQILLRGCSLRNTEWVVGAVIFTGHETKVMMNTMDVPSKRSTLEKKMDLIIMILFGVLFTLCLFGSIGSAIYMDESFWFLSLNSSSPPEFNPNNKIGVIFLSFFTLLTLFSTIIPISLYVSIEMIKFIQSTQFINKDLNMFHHETQTPALARTSNLNEELGQIEYIFTDKTGTLTQNKMEFFKCSIGGIMYGTGVTEVQKMISKKKGSAIATDPAIDEHFLHEKGFNFNDKRLMRGAWKQEPTAEVCKEFFRLLSICHTVLPEGNETPDGIKYLASSPDEAAMVAAAKNFGFFFYRRTPTSVRVREMHVEKLGRAQDLEYEILNVLEFSSNRKRQSVIARFPNGRLVLYCKGADNVIFERLNKTNSKYKDMTRQHLEKFGADGLRTLCLAFRDLDESFYEEWNKKFTIARSVLRDREKKLEEVYELIEKELMLIGCTAIEDKLQDGVSNCIEILQRAGLKFWVLTGDKLETAINIAYACSLLNNDMRQFIVSSETDSIREVEERGDASDTTRVIRESVFQQLREIVREAEVLHDQGFPISFIIDGRSLTHALEPLMFSTLIQLGLMCSTVICCRVSPLQKAQVTSLIKDGANKITLSIGDGANDVSMIQAAHVGVGISGNEGMQAVLASDFSIAQFKYLVDLLLIHGRWSYIRLSKVVGYFFYKNLAFTLTLFWFNCYAALSGQRLYDDWFQSSYNVVFTALPVVAVGIFDQDVDAKRSKQYPELYRAGIKNAFFNRSALSRWLFFAVFHSLIFFFLPSTIGKYFISSNGKVLGIWDIGTTIYTIIVFTVNLRLLLAVTFITVWHVSSVLVSILLWFVLVFGYDALSPSQSNWSAQSNQYWVIYVLMTTSYFWLVLFLVPFVALLPDFFYNSVQRRLFPHDYQIIQEDIKFHQRSEEFIERERILEMQAMGELSTRPRGDAARREAMASLPSLASKRHTGFAFDTPGFESFFAQQEGISSPARAWDVARRASMHGRRSNFSELPTMASFPTQLSIPKSSSSSSSPSSSLINKRKEDVGTSRQT